MTLIRNYRSNVELIDWFNETFGPAFRNHNMTYDDMAVSEGRNGFDTSGQEKLLKGVYKMQGDDTQSVSDLIKALVEGGYRIVVKQNGSYAVKPIQYSDIMVMTKSTFNLVDYAEGIRREGVPVNVIGNVNQSNNEPEILKMIQHALRKFLAYVDYTCRPYDYRRQVILLQLITERDYLELTDKEREREEKKVRKARVFRKRFTPPGMAAYFQKHFELLMPVGAVEDYVYQEIRRIYNGLYETLVAENVQSYEEMSEIVDAYIKKKLERLAFLSEDEDAVLLMNAHKTKGLQAPIVIRMKVRRPAEWRFLARSQPMMDESPTARAIRSRMPGSESSAAQLPSNEDIGS